MSTLQQRTLERLQVCIKRETKKRIRSSGGVVKSGEYEMKLSDLACGLRREELTQLYEWVSSKSTWKKVKFVLKIDDVGQKRGVDRKVQIHTEDIRDTEDVHRVMNDLINVQILNLNDDAMDASEAGGDSLALSRREEPTEAPELTGDFYEDLQNMKTVADVNKVRAYFNQMCDACVPELKSKKRNRQSGEAEEDNAEELEGRSAYEDAALKGLMCYIVVVIDNSL